MIEAEDKGLSRLSPLQRKLDRELRMVNVIDMYMAGESYESISQVTGTTRQTAYNDVKYALSVLARQREGMTTRMIDTQMLRYNRLLQIWMPKAIEGGDRATDKVISIMREINKLFMLGSYGDGGGSVGPQRVELKWGDVVQVNVNIDNGGNQLSPQQQEDIIEGVITPTTLLPLMPSEFEPMEFDLYEQSDDGDQASAASSEPV